MSYSYRRIRRQAGVVLIVALIALAAMTLAGIALVRSMDTGLLISGNLAFKQATFNATEVGMEAAAKWLQDIATGPTGSTALWTSDAPHGYYATVMDAVSDSCDMTGNRTTSSNDDVGWVDADHPSAAAKAECGMTAANIESVTGVTMPAGYSGSFVINRLCPATGKPDASCTFCLGDDLSKSTKRGAHYHDRPLPFTSNTYYRITTRVLGPRNSLSYAQAFVCL